MQVQRNIIMGHLWWFPNQFSCWDNVYQLYMFSLPFYQLAYKQGLVTFTFRTFPNSSIIYWASLFCQAHQLFFLLLSKVAKSHDRDGTCLFVLTLSRFITLKISSISPLKIVITLGRAQMLKTVSFGQPHQIYLDRT